MKSLGPVTLITSFTLMSVAIHTLGFTGIAVLAPKAPRKNGPVEIEINNPEEGHAATKPARSPSSVEMPPPPPPVATLTEVAPNAKDVKATEGADSPEEAPLPPEEQPSVKAGRTVDEIEAASARRAASAEAAPEEGGVEHRREKAITSNSNGTAGENGGNEGEGSATGGIARAGSVGEGGGEGDSIGPGGTAESAAALAGLLLYGRAMGGMPAVAQPAVVPSLGAGSGGGPSFGPIGLPGPATQQNQCPGGLMCGPVCRQIMSDPMNCGGCGTQCKGMQNCSLGICTGGDNRQWAASWAILPAMTSDFSIDLNGDGVPDNQFVNFRTAMNNFGIDLALSINNLLGAGLVSVLFDVPPDADKTSPVSIFSGLPDSPDFLNDPIFKVDPKATRAPFTGTRTMDSTEFTGMAKAGGVPPALRMFIRSPYIPNAQFLIPFRCHRLHLAFRNGTGQAPGLDPTKDALALAKATAVIGELQGSIRGVDLDILVADIGNFMTQVLQSNSASLAPYKKLIEAAFDNGGCTDADGTVAFDGDFIVNPCEVTKTKVVRDGLALDIKVYDAAGNFDPKGIKGKPDSLSFGFEFYGAPAKFQ